MQFVSEHSYMYQTVAYGLFATGPSDLWGELTLLHNSGKARQFLRRWEYSQPPNTKKSTYVL